MSAEPRGVVGDGSPTGAVECAHDWRVNPHIVLTSNPPQLLLVCAKCRAQKASGFLPQPMRSDDPATWEPWPRG